MAFYLPLISLEADLINVKESRGNQVKGFDYQQFILADSAKILLSNNAAYTDLHHIGEFIILQRMDYSQWLKNPINYILLENPSSLPYSWHVIDWDGFGHKAKKTSTYEIIPVNSTGKRISIDIQTENLRTVLMFNNPGWIIVDPCIHDAIYALEY
jgi:hypothetical protein